MLAKAPIARRQCLGGAFCLVAAAACSRVIPHAGADSSDNTAPEKIHLIPDADRIVNVGRLADGRQYFVDGQLYWAGGSRKDFVCTFVFDRDGRLVAHTIELI